MRRHHIAITILTLCAGAPPYASLAQAGQVPAAPPPATSPAAPAPQTALTLAQATAMALQSHPQIVAAQDTAASAGQHITEARAPYYPAAQNTQSTGYDVVPGVNRGYFGVLQAQAYVTVANETVTNRQTLTDQVTALANANLKSQQLDVNFAAVNLSEAKLLLIRSQDAVEQAYADLARAPGQEQVVEPPISDAIQNRPELRSGQLQLQGAQSFEQAEADLSHPSVSFVAVGGGLPYLGQDPRVAPCGYEGAALNVDVPIFNGHLFSARRQAAHYETRATGERLRNIRQQVERDVRAAWISASAAYQRIPVTEEFIKQAQLALQLAEGRYNLGLASIVEITQAQFRSLVDPFLIMPAIPMGFIGVLIILPLTHTTLNVMSLAGVLMPIGIADSNSILIVDFAHKLEEQGLSAADAVITACRVRLRPILMTSLATIIGLDPMALKLGTGGEQYTPMARAIIGGLASSVLLTIFIVPAAYLLVYGKKKRSAE